MNYPIKCKARNRPHFVGRECNGGCGHKFAPNDKVVIVEVQTNWFRGDDEVYCYCPECHAKLEAKK